MLSIKHSLASPYGLFYPLPNLVFSRKSITLDFITDLFLSKGFDAMLTLVDQFTKMAHFFLSMKTINSEETANIGMREVFFHHGLPYDIINDHGPHLKFELIKF